MHTREFNLGEILVHMFQSSRFLTSVALSASILSSLLITNSHNTHCTLALTLGFTELAIVNLGAVIVVVALHRPRSVHRVLGSCNKNETTRANIKR